ncbi:MAG TPA: divalent-cation tolerance protein CutA [Candidatus Acidoferrales bacterium]|jgi:periplasmic divalent cation tolerance protein|nr:divalent-cation tolerance protein CutA [Candidatus Acidoferrales bacterium]
MTDKIVVLVICASAGQARKIARTLVVARLAACGNVFEAPVRSIYRWRGRVESAKEFLLLLKTSRKRFAAVERAVRALHTYDLPEIIAVPIAVGARNYLKWISESVRPANK